MFYRNFGIWSKRPWKRPESPFSQGRNESKISQYCDQQGSICCKLQTFFFSSSIKNSIIMKNLKRVQFSSLQNINFEHLMEIYSCAKLLKRLELTGCFIYNREKMKWQKFICFMVLLDNLFTNLAELACWCGKSTV